MVKQPYRGKGGLHTEIHKNLRTQDPTLSPRDALTESVLRTRKVYREHNRYSPELRDGLQKTIKQNKEVHPHLFNKHRK